MATRCFIGKSLPSNHIIGIYCHYDGYPDGGVGEMLETNYMDETKIDALLELGDISTLGPELGEKHDPKDHKLINAMGWTTAYHRDAGEDLNPLREYESLPDMEKNVAGDLGAEWAYVWMVDRWETISL